MEIASVLDGSAAWCVAEGDCLDVLRTMPDKSLDAVVTDPPYGLSAGSTKGISDRLGDVLLNVALPDLYDANAKIGRVPQFFGPLDSVSFLDFMLRAARVEPGIAVPESSVDFEGYVARQKKVEHAGECAVTVADGNLALAGDALPLQFGGDYILQPRASGNSVFGYGKGRLFTQLGAGRFAVPVVVPTDSSFAGFLRTLAPGGSPLLGDLIGLLDDALSDANGSASVMAGTRAELHAVLAFDTGNGSLELLPASATSDDDLVFEVCAAHPVRAGAGAGGLAAKFEPRCFRFVGDAAGRTLAFHFHRALLSEMQYSRKGFMGKDWDSEVPSEAVWRECLRVLKPGGHLLAFAGTRTQHRMACNIEDAGFEIRDMIAWIYGSGFPKSLDVSKAIDKAAGAERTMRVNERWADRYPNGPGGNLNAGDDGQQYGQLNRVSGNPLLTSDPVSPEAQQWAGWGTALKPAIEDWWLLRKPLIGTVAENVLAHGTGAINVDGCRVGDEVRYNAPAGNKAGGNSLNMSAVGMPQDAEGRTVAGRWPANLILSDDPEVLAGFPVTTSGGGDKHGRKASTFCTSTNWESLRGTSNGGDTGSAARFFYVAKASKRDRDDGLDGFEVKRTGGMQATADGTMLTGKRTTSRANTHPTVKPTDLMRYLCRLVTPPGGVVLDPFMGSGSTGKAARLEGFRFIGIERDPEYARIAQARIAHVDITPEPPAQKTLFD